MKEKIKKLFTFLIFPFVFIVLVIGSVFNLFKKEEPKNEEYPLHIRENPHTIETKYSDPFQGRNLIIKSINASASVVDTFDNFLNKEI